MAATKVVLKVVVMAEMKVDSLELGILQRSHTKCPQPIHLAQDLHYLLRQ